MLLAGCGLFVAEHMNAGLSLVVFTSSPPLSCQETLLSPESPSGVADVPVHQKS
jgi:hypothetical protein